MIKHCLWCGKEFETVRDSKKYCNYSCFAKDMISKRFFSYDPTDRQRIGYTRFRKGLQKPKPKLRSWRKR